MVEISQQRFAMGSHPRHQQCRPVPQIRGVYPGAVKMICALDHGGTAIHFYIRSHASEFVAVPVAVFKNTFAHHRDSPGHGEHCNELGLNIRGKAGIRQRF